MKSVCVCSSFKFFDKVLELEELLEENNIDCLRPVPSKKFRKQDKPDEFIDDFDQFDEESKKEEAEKLTQEHFERIDRSDVVYVVSPNGYVGNSVSLELGYAHAQEKPIYSESELDDYNVVSVVEGVLSYQELVDFMKD